MQSSGSGALTLVTRSTKSPYQGPNAMTLYNEPELVNAPPLRLGFRFILPVAVLSQSEALH